MKVGRRLKSRGHRCAIDALLCERPRQVPQAGRNYRQGKCGQGSRCGHGYSSWIDKAADGGVVVAVLWLTRPRIFRMAGSMLLRDGHTSPPLTLRSWLEPPCCLL